MKRLSLMTILLGVLAAALFSSAAQAAEHCPENLSHLGEEMDALLKGVHVKEFKRTMRSALQASIPQAIERADGIKEQMAFLRERNSTPGPRGKKCRLHCPRRLEKFGRAVDAL